MQTYTFKKSEEIKEAMIHLLKWCWSGSVNPTANVTHNL